MKLVYEAIFTPCFNRYMVECELQKRTTKIVTLICFNRYMVECE